MITFVATSYKEKYDPYQFISCLLLQTDPRWKCIICCDGQNDDVDKAVEFFNDSRISIYKELTAKGSWGHPNRKKALDELVDTEFVIQTSIQDYYLPNTVSSILEFKDYDLVYFNCIHHSFNYNILSSELIRCRIDWGSFAVRTSIAKSVGIQDVESSICDGLFAEKCAAYPDIKIGKLDVILTVHN